MKVLIASKGETLDSRFDSRFGRAAYFLVHDTETGETEAHRNEAASAGHGAGVRAGSLAANLECDAAIGGNIGPKAFSTLRQGGVKVYLSRAETAGEALRQYLDGELPEQGDANVRSHR
jgi:predicted Fe-Mo cluster-binding NifX family protein